MTKNEHSKLLRIRFLMALPLAGMIIALFAFKASIPGKVAEPLKTALSVIKIAEKDAFTSKDTTVYVEVDENAKFQGGDLNTFRNYIMNHVKYPINASKMGVQGKVIINFVVDYDGNVTKVKILRSLDKECDEESIRVIQNSPKWTPGKKDGKNVSQSFVLPVVFILQNTK